MLKIDRISVAILEMLAYYTHRHGVTERARGATDICTGTVDVALWSPSQDVRLCKRNAFSTPSDASQILFRLFNVSLPSPCRPPPPKSSQLDLPRHANLSALPAFFPPSLAPNSISSRTQNAVGIQRVFDHFIESPKGAMPPFIRTGHLIHV